MLTKQQTRKLLILLVGVLLVLIGILYQVKQNSSLPVQNTAQSKKLATVLTASLQQQRRYFQRCWLKSHPLSQSGQQDEPSPQMTWQIFLKIEPSGKVKDFLLLNKSLFDAETEKCLKEISFRLKFPSFEGEEISITVPIVISSISENR